MHYLVYIIAITIILLLSTIALYLRLKLSHLVEVMEKLSSPPIDQASIDFEKGLIRSAIDHALMRALYYYGTIDIKFSETSPVKNFYKGHYRDLVTYLLRQDVLITNYNLWSKSEMVCSFFIPKMKGVRKIATTGIWKIEKRLDNVIDYTTNIEKTITYDVVLNDYSLSIFLDILSIHILQKNEQNHLKYLI